eukprot:jgi/Tetstr1/448220/TSEL_035508.t1
MASTAQYQRDRRSQPGVRDTESRRRALDRIAADHVPRAATLAKWGISAEDVNRIRAQKDLPPLDFGNEPPEAQVHLPEPRSGSGSQTVQDILAKVDAIRGKQMIGRNGKPAKKPDGSPKNISDSSVDQYKRGVRAIAEIAACEAREDFGKCLRDHEAVIGKVRDRYPKENSFKTIIGSIVSTAKYIKPFRDTLGQEAHDAYHEAMVGSIVKAETQAIIDTETQTVEPLDEIKKGLDEIGNKFGKQSDRYLEAKLQVDLAGIRDDLSSVAIVQSERTAQQKGIKNFYVPQTRKLVIAEFKTAKSYPPYEFKLSAENADLVADSLKRKPRKNLFPARVGRRVAAAFEDVGLDVGVNTIRHSWITTLIGSNPSEANVRRVAAKFKHKPVMSLRYFRGAPPSEEED